MKSNNFIKYKWSVILRMSILLALLATQVFQALPGAIPPYGSKAVLAASHHSDSGPDQRVTWTPSPTPRITATFTPLPPSPVPPTATFTPPPPRYTDTPDPPTATNTPPRPTNTVKPPNTPTATPTRPSASPTPTVVERTDPTPLPELVFHPGMNVVEVLGCDPSPGGVRVGFIPVQKFGMADFPTPEPSEPPVWVTAQASDRPRRYVFQTPVFDPSILFLVLTEVEGPDCTPASAPPPDYWISGNPLNLVVIPEGKTSLLASSQGKDPPGYKGEIFAGSWVTDVQFTGSPKNHAQTFKWETSLKNANGGVLQASIFPFSNSIKGDQLSTAGLVATWPVDCVNCEFTVDMTVLAPKPLTEEIPAEQQKVSVIGQMWNSIVKGVQNAWNWMLNLAGLGGQQPAKVAPAGLEGTKTNSTSAIDFLKTGSNAPLLINQYYFRIVPLEKSSVAGAVSNPVEIQWNAPEIELAPPCQVDPKTLSCPQSPIPMPFIIEIIEYHGILPPVPGHHGCYVVTKDTALTTKMPSPSGDSYVTHFYKAGDTFCPPKPKEKSWFEAIVSFVVDAVNWVSEAYASLKSAIVDIVANFVPSSLCGKTCLGAILDAGLVALGLPPSLPNFDQLLNQGLDYLAEQAVSQIGIPPSVYNSIDPSLTGIALELALKEAESQFKEQAEKEFKKGMQAGLEAAQKALSETIAWIPNGLPVKPDPLGDYQPAAMTLRVTRNPQFPTEMCTSSTNPLQANILVRSWVKNDFSSSMLASQLEIFNNNVQKGQEISPNKDYELFEMKSIPLPADLAPGDSRVIPIVFKPQFAWGTPGGWSSFSDAAQAWNVIYFGGQGFFLASNPCSQGASLDIDTQAQYSK